MVVSAYIAELRSLLSGHSTKTVEVTRLGSVLGPGGLHGRIASYFIFAIQQVPGRTKEAYMKRGLAFQHHSSLHSSYMHRSQDVFNQASEEERMNSHVALCIMYGMFIGIFGFTEIDIKM